MEESRESSHGVMGLAWLPKLLPKLDVRVRPAEVALAGWVWKRSTYLHLWRRRWLVLTVNGHLVSYEDERQSGATGCFRILSLSPSSRNGDVDDIMLAEVEVPSQRAAALLHFGFGAGSHNDDAPSRRMQLGLDAGPRNNLMWEKAIAAVLRQHDTRPEMPGNATELH
eukprot:CAMPEP_0181455104 /NCGR_PEP_ID=MMETSP1110-20121109/30585_1 /TAXON_ID=174948 /ORGANISM="Symbiodinium sp., Strain CCMP421" /LENGTH=167 /DNA_ID=CAMNT_0023579477 /DNA_START=30 /DNA_END=533 /DNA_ORIENTATION=+